MNNPWSEYPLPGNLDAERSVLGAALSNPEAFDRIKDSLAASDFELEKHKRIFLRMGDLDARGESLSCVSLANELMKHGQELKSVDGIAYLVSLEGPELANLETHCRIVREKSILRRTIALCRSLEIRCLTGTDSPEELLRDAERAVDTLSASGTRRLAARTVEEIIFDEGGPEAFLRPEKKPGIPIPFTALDATMNSLRPGKLIVVAARTSVGKTTMLWQWGENASAHGHRSVYISLEMSGTGLLHGSIASRANVSSYKFRQGRLAPIERASVQREMHELAELGDKLLIVDTEITISGIAALLRSLAARGSRTDLLIVDYLQLVSSLDRSENRVQEVAALSRGLKKISRQFQIPVVAASQLIRQPATEEPQLHWLKESGAIEQDSDAVVFLWLKKDPQEGDAMREVCWKVAKNRDGMLNRGSLNFYPKYRRFKESEEQEEVA